MKTQRLNALLATFNFALLFWLALGAKSAPEHPDRILTSVRSQKIELVDERGQVRAQFIIEANGEAVFRMRDSTGAVRVKLGASGEGSGLVLLNNATETGLQALANRDGTTLTLRNQNGHTRTIAPQE
jgi:hypothetical protein